MFTSATWQKKYRATKLKLDAANKEINEQKAMVNKLNKLVALLKDGSQIIWRSLKKNLQSFTTIYFITWLFWVRLRIPVGRKKKQKKLNLFYLKLPFTVEYSSQFGTERTTVGFSNWNGANYFDAWLEVKNCELIKLNIDLEFLPRFKKGAWLFLEWR